MNGPITRTMIAEHARIGALLQRAHLGDRGSYEQFRGLLLRHIGIEEKILLVAIRACGREVPSSAQLRLDHSAIVAMLVPTPTPALLNEIGALLSLHDLLEEREGGLYSLADELLPDVDDILARMDSAPIPPLARHFDGPRAFAAIESHLARAREGRSRP